MNRQAKVAAALFFIFLAGCTKAPDAADVTVRKGVSATVSGFRLHTVKTTLQPDGSGIPAFKWAEGDEIGVVPNDRVTYQTNYSVNEVGSTPEQAWFDGGAWKLKEGYKYLAYYPCSYDKSFTSAEKITLSVSGQTQTANASTSHLGSYDFLYAGEQAYNDGHISLNFSHLVSLLKISVTAASSGTFSSLILSTEDGYLVSEASLALSDGSLTESVTGSSLEMSLGDIYVEKDDILELWIALLPSSGLEGKKFTISLKRTSGSKTRFTADGFKFEAGDVYTMSFNESTDTDNRPASGYKSWIGSWNIGNETWNVTEYEEGTSYKIAGVNGDPFDVGSITAYYDMTKDALEIKAVPNCASIEILDQEASVSLFGIVTKDDGELIISCSADNPYTICTITHSDYETATATPATVNVSDMGQLTLEGIHFVCTTLSSGATLVMGSWTTLPNTLLDAESSKN